MFDNIAISIRFIFGTSTNAIKHRNGSIIQHGHKCLLGQTSYITKAISAVLQLGVTMDFAIFLYHSYKAEKEKSFE